MTSGVHVTSFTLAVQRNFKNKNNENETDFINCVAYRNTADLMGNHCFKGQLIAVSGRLQVRSWDTDNGRRYATEVIVNNIEVLEWKEKNVQQQADEYFDNIPNQEINEDDLPF